MNPLKEFRANKNYSQAKMARELEKFARKMFPVSARRLPQRTLADWELGNSMPNKFWLVVIENYSGGQLKANDFVYFCSLVSKYQCNKKGFVKLGNEKPEKGHSRTKKISLETKENGTQSGA